WIGILVWTWLGFMNPHRLAWGFSTTLPFAMIVAVTTMVAILFSREPKKLVWEREMLLMLVFLLWMVVTSFAAFFPELAWQQFEKVAKIFLMIFVATMVITTRQRLVALVWVIALSIGFYGVKGGIFTLMTGGAFHVRGPSGTFIDGNNEIGLALAMTLPLLYYLSLSVNRIWVRYAFIGAMALTVIAALGTQSRGAMLGLGAMTTFLWLKSRRKFQVGILIVLAVMFLVPVMPESWFERMSTVKTYEEDASAQGRIAAWKMAFNLASSRLTGGGFETFREWVFNIYGTGSGYVADAHSIYFEVLGEHGWPGLAIFLAIAASTWLSASGVIRAAKRSDALKWLADLMAMVQVSQIAYLATGAFLGMAYFDYYYSLVLLVALAKTIVARHRASAAALAATGAAPPPVASANVSPPLGSAAAGKVPGRISVAR
ncbi:MAG: putative O-glycosylation ligase, exosortase A system-associated, partial [Betaproteobacteria bacterium CG2_30_68_42]